MCKPLVMVGRSIAFVCGFHNVKVVGQRAKSTEAGILTVAPHSSFFDAIFGLIGDELPVGVSRIENLAVPFLGSMYYVIYIISYI